MSELTISIRDLRRLVEPVMPFASHDDMIPVLNCVRAESRGTHLVAFTTDCFRLACQRIAAPEGTPFPEWEATIPLSSLRSLFQTYKAKRFSEPVITLTIDKGALRVHGDEALMDLLDASVTYPLSEGEFPKVRSLFRNAIASEDGGSVTGFNPKFLADFSRCGSVIAARLTGGDKAPVMFADGEDFIALLMPRRMEGPTGAFPSLDSWTDLLAEKPEKKKKIARKAKGAAA